MQFPGFERCFFVLWFPWQVRSRAQGVLFTALGTYNFCCRDLIPHVLEFLDPNRSDVTQQQFKVCYRQVIVCYLAFIQRG